MYDYLNMKTQCFKIIHDKKNGSLIITSDIVNFKAHKKK